MRPRSMATASCGLAIEILLMHVRPGWAASPSRHYPRRALLRQRHGLFLDDVYLPVAIHGDARRVHLRRRLAEHLLRQRPVVLGAVAARRVAEDGAAEAGALRELDVAADARSEEHT